MSEQPLPSAVVDPTSASQEFADVLNGDSKLLATDQALYPSMQIGMRETFSDGTNTRIFGELTIPNNQQSTGPDAKLHAALARFDHPDGATTYGIGGITLREDGTPWLTGKFLLLEAGQKYKMGRNVQTEDGSRELEVPDLWPGVHADMSMSREHFTLEVTKAGLRCTDTSTNGTGVRGFELEDSAISEQSSSTGDQTELLPLSNVPSITPPKVELPPLPTGSNPTLPNGELPPLPTGSSPVPPKVELPPLPTGSSEQLTPTDLPPLPNDKLDPPLPIQEPDGVQEGGSSLAEDTPSVPEDAPVLPTQTKAEMDPSEPNSILEMVDSPNLVLSQNNLRAVLRGAELLTGIPEPTNAEMDGAYQLHAFALREIIGPEAAAQIAIVSTEAAQHAITDWLPTLQHASAELYKTVDARVRAFDAVRSSLPSARAAIQQIHEILSQPAFDDNYYYGAKAALETFSEDYQRTVRLIENSQQLEDAFHSVRFTLEDQTDAVRSLNGRMREGILAASEGYVEDQEPVIEAVARRNAQTTKEHGEACDRDIRTNTERSTQFAYALENVESHVQTLFSVVYNTDSVPRHPSHVRDAIDSALSYTTRVRYGDRDYIGLAGQMLVAALDELARVERGLEQATTADTQNNVYLTQVKQSISDLEQIVQR